MNKKDQTLRKLSTHFNRSDANVKIRQPNEESSMKGRRRE